MRQKYDIAAYVWPSYTGDEPRTRMFWKEGYGEWQTVQNARKNSAEKPEGYVWDRKGALQNALNKKHISWPRKGLADVSFCGRIKLL